MTPADLSLCRELYRVSGWDNDEPFQLHPDGEMYPAYDAGFLLRKLLPETPIKFIAQSDGRTLILYADETDTYQEKTIYGATPENCLAQLAIELFKAKVLTKEAV